MQFNSIQFNSIQFNSIQFNSIQFIQSHPPPQLDANSMRVLCSHDAAAAATKKQLCQELKVTCKADLDTALPALNSAVEALKSLSKGDIGEMKCDV